MNKLLTAVAGIALLSAPLAANAAPPRGGGSFHGGGAPHAGAVHSGGGFRGAPPSANRGSGFVNRGGTFRGSVPNYRGYRGGYYPRYGYDRYGYAVGGLGLGLLAGAALANSYSAPSYYDDDYGYPAYDTQGYACGQWIWHPELNRYLWEDGAC